MLGDKGIEAFGVKRSVQIERTLRSLNWGGNFFLFILISTGELNTKQLLCMWTSW